MKLYDIYSSCIITKVTWTHFGLQLIWINSINMDYVLLWADCILLICSPAYGVQLVTCLSMGGGQIEKFSLDKGKPKNQTYKIILAHDLKAFKFNGVLT